MARIGFVGAGRMGQPMAERLVGAGAEVVAHAHSPAGRERLEAAGLRVASDLAEVAAEADAVVVCVYRDEQVAEVALGPNGLVGAMSAGSVLVIHTTGSPDTAKRIAEAGRDRDVAVVDAPVSGGPHEIAAGRITVFLGGSEDAVGRAEPVLAAYANPVFRTGALGTGQVTKLVNNALFAANISVAVEALRLGTELGVEPAALLAALPDGSSASRGLSMLASSGSAAAMGERVGPFLAKDVGTVRAVAASIGADLGLLETVLSADGMSQVLGQRPS